jgi:glycerol uptake facilitator-like aquaporin
MGDMKKYPAELPGTFVLVFIGTGSATPKSVLFREYTHP